MEGFLTVYWRLSTSYLPLGKQGVVLHYEIISVENIIDILNSIAFEIYLKEDAIGGGRNHSAVREYVFHCSRVDYSVHFPQWLTLISRTFCSAISFCALDSKQHKVMHNGEAFLM